jgi:outer membrane protein assembly factor BamD
MESCLNEYSNPPLLHHFNADKLDGADKSITLPVPMKFRVLPLLFSFALSLFLVQSSDAAVVFRPGEKAKYVAPGEEELNGNAAELFEIGQKAEKESNPKRAIRAYKTLVRKYPRDALAGGAAFRGAVLYEQVHQYIEAANTYRLVVTNYPTSPHFNESIEGQFRIGEMYLAGKKLKLLGIPFGTSMDRAVEIFAAVIRTAPYGKYTARAQFDIGLAREKQGANDAALQAYQAVIDKFPNDPIAVDAQYQIGYIWFTASRAGTKDLAATNKARTGFQDFLFRFPNSEKAAQARANLQQLEHKSTSSSFDVARYYDRQKYYRAAVIYYNEVIRQQPGSAESEKAKKRIDQLRAKVGDKVLQSLQDTEKQQKADQDKTKGVGQEKTKNAGPSAPALDSAPVLPPDLDSTLPPPPSSSSDTTAPSSSSSEPEASARPEPSSTPEQSSEQSATPSAPEDSGSSEAAASPTP